MKEAAFRQYCRERGLSDEDVGKAVTAVLNLEAFARHRDKTLESLDTQTLQDHISQLVIQGDNTPERLRALQDYMRATCNGDLVVHLLGLLAGREVLPNIAQRLEQLAGPAARASVFQGLELPPLGSPQSAYPAVTQQVVARLRGALPEETCMTVLAGNHHQIPAERFAALRTIYLEKGLDAALAHRHRELVKQLEAHLASGEPWFEQMVTPAFVDHVRHNPEIGAGVREGDRVYFTKVPYAPQQYYDERDPTMKRYYQCHCPLARASILGKTVAVDPVFCYCSGGFTKVAFDVVFGQPVKVEVLESALAGDMRCRFTIGVPEGQLV